MYVSVVILDFFKAKVEWNLNYDNSSKIIFIFYAKKPILNKSLYYLLKIKVKYSYLNLHFYRFKLKQGYK